MPVKILVLTHNYPRFQGDFSGVFLALLLRELCEHDFEPVVLAPHNADTPLLEIIDGVKILRFRYESDQRETLAYRGNMQDVIRSPRGWLQFYKFLASFEHAALDCLKSEKFDAIWGHWLVPAGIVLRRIGFATPLPMVLSSHGSDLRLGSQYPALVRLYFRPLFSRMRAWTVVSEFLAHHARAISPAVEEKIHIMPMPQDGSIFYADPNITKEQLLVVSVTRFTEQKRVLQLIEAFSQVRARLPQAKLQLYGTGSLKLDIETLVDKFALRDAVSINPPVDQAILRTVYNRASVVVLNSVQEGFGLTLTEAMLCGSAVIGTRSGGIPEIIESGHTGLLVPPDNPTELANAIFRLLSDRSLLSKLTRAGQQYAFERFASPEAASKFASLFREVIGSTKK